MKQPWIVALFFVFLVFGAQGKAEVTTVPHVDLNRYVGTWYEVASIPHSFQKQCVGNVTAVYKDLGEGLIEVINSCEKKDGSRSVSEGRAKVVDTDSQAKLKVTFVKLWSWIYMFGGDYWVIDLDKDYRYAVVGHPSRKYGWILSREPTLALKDLKLIAENLNKQDYDLCGFLMTVQSGGPTVRVPLCEYLKSQAL